MAGRSRHERRPAGLPPILVVYVLGFGMPALGLWNNEFFWGLLALVLIYSAYVSEVYRAGIESVHPSQDAAARSLGLSQSQSMRFVIVPQAVRRIIPPLLNDFIGLTKDTALVSLIGVVEAFRRAQIEQAGAFPGPVVLRHNPLELDRHGITRKRDDASAKLAIQRCEGRFK